MMDSLPRDSISTLISNSVTEDDVEVNTSNDQPPESANRREGPENDYGLPESGEKVVSADSKEGKSVPIASSPPYYEDVFPSEASLTTLSASKGSSKDIKTTDESLMPHAEDTQTDEKMHGDFKEQRVSLQGFANASFDPTPEENYSSANKTILSTEEARSTYIESSSSFASLDIGKENVSQGVLSYKASLGLVSYLMEGKSLEGALSSSSSEETPAWVQLTQFDTGRSTLSCK